MATEYTPISWTDSTWNPLRGCSRVSAGCERCYAETMAGRFSGIGQPYEGLVRRTTNGFRWTGAMRFIPEALAIPFRWKKGRKIFVNSMSDLFHEQVKDEWLDACFDVMRRTPQHTYQILTKRAARMAFYLEGKSVEPHIWLGVSVENQETANQRICELLTIDAKVRVVSYEPALGPINLCSLTPFLAQPGVTVDALRGDWVAPSGERLSLIPPASLAWVICGGESGPKARECRVEWLRSVKDQCAAAGVACWMKQYGAAPMYTSRFGTAFPCILHDSKGADMAEWDEDMQVQQFPDMQHSQLTLVES